MELTYIQAILNFPGTIREEILPRRPSVIYDKVRFVRNEFCIEAIIQPYFLLHDLPENTQVQKEVIEPTLKLVSTDLATVDDLLPTLESLARARIVQDSLIYNRETEGKKFKVYDYSGTFSGSVDHDDRLFARMLLFRGVNKRVVAAENRDLVDMAEYVSQDVGKIPHVEGLTLREAVERAISIYNLAERLRKI